MTHPDSVCLVTQLSSPNSSSRPLARARFEAFKALLKSECLVKEWPSGGVDLDQIGQKFRDMEEFWITPEATECIVLRFGAEETFKVFDIETWGWFLRKEYPCAVVRCLPRVGGLPDMIRQKEINASAFKLAMLSRLFHDMKYWQNPKICQKAAKWLASLEKEVLEPFKYLQDRRHWEDWYLGGSKSRFRRARVNILDDGKRFVNENAQFFWQQVCWQYELWAKNGLTAKESSDLSRQLKQW